MIHKFSPPRVITLLTLILAIAACSAAESSSPMAFPTTPLLDPNSATEAQLLKAPGLTAQLVAKIIAGRPYATPSALHAAIGADLNENSQQLVYGSLFIKVGLNTGAGDDYKLIPSTMSPRKLAHEFDEYRPYESIEQFRREMAKYVSDEEVDYLARYVTLE